MALTEVKVPDIGDFKDVNVIEILVKPGDDIKEEQSLITVESDKASMEVPSSCAGIVRDIAVKLGDTLNKGDLIMTVDSQGEEKTSTLPQDVPPKEVSTPSVAAPPSQPAKSAAPQEVSASPAALPHASPSIRKLARELGVDLYDVTGSGLKGRITREDVQNHVRNGKQGETGSKASEAQAITGLNLLPWPQIDFAAFGAIERKALPRIKKISAANLHRNWVMIPHVTNNDTADITELEEFRVKLNKENEKEGLKITMLAFVIKASITALKAFPQFNSSLDGDELVFKYYYNIGFAADTPNGLMVPVIRDADKKGISDISKDLAELSAKARNAKLTPSDMTGATFTISSLGGIGGTGFTPIINAPEVAILGLSRSAMQPVWNGREFLPRLMLPLSLSYDHRVIDGADAARFNAYLAKLLADFRRVLL